LPEFAGLAVTEAKKSLTVGLRRDDLVVNPRIVDAGCYFSGNALIPGTKGPIPMPFDDFHKGTLEDVEYFLNHQGDMKRNHLAAGLFALVYDTRVDAEKIIEGAVLARNDTVDGKMLFEFDIHPGNRTSNDYQKYADFVSSAISPDGIEGGNARKAKYMFLDTGVLAPVLTDPLNQGERHHGDRLALDIFKTNPDLFFRLIRRTAHRADLKILAMGARYYSSYNACNDCFSKVYTAVNPLKDQLNLLALSQNYVQEPSL
jgi:hypothetical protein